MGKRGGGGGGRKGDGTWLRRRLKLSTTNPLSSITTNRGAWVGLPPLALASYDNFGLVQ